MRLFKSAFFIAIFLLIFAGNSNAAINFPYGNIYLSFPTYADPYPGLGNYYSALSNGMNTSLWNPAGIMKINTIEADVSIPINLGNFPFQRTFNIEDTSFTASQTGLTTGVFFTDDLSDLTVKQRSMDANAAYYNSGSSLLFDQAIRINDNFAFGVKTIDNINAEIDLAGEVPVTSQYTADFSSWTSGGVAINSSGQLTYTYLGVPYVSAGNVWSGFLNQEDVLPTKAIVSSRNSFNVKETLVFNGGAKYKNFSFGLNFIPIKANASFDNSVQAVVNKTASDLTFYTPNFDATNVADITNWTTNAGRYGTINGYTANTIAIPEGEVVLDSRWNGNYSGSAMRMDLGLDYQVSDFFNISLAAENFNGASLAMKGSGISYYANHRFNTATSPNIDPVSGINWSPFVNGAVDFSFVDGKGLYLENEKTYAIPKKMRVGFALKKPFLIVVDYETMSNPVYLGLTGSDGKAKSVAISNMNVLRLGSEMQLFRLPVWLNGGFGFLFKPSCDDSEVQAKIDSTFKLFGKRVPIFPVKFDLGIQSELYGTKTGFAFGLDGLSLISIYSIDLVNNNIGKTLYCTLYTKKNSWQFAFTASADPFATYTDLQAKNRSIYSIQFGDIKWSQAVSVSYAF